MKILTLYQSKNEGLENNRAILEQSKIMSDGIIILDDGSTDGSFPDEIIKDPHVLDYVKLPEKEMYEGINMSVLLNLAHKHNADWCYFPGGHYRFVGKLNKFKSIIEEYDKVGVTHINIRWFTMWDKTNYRTDGAYNPQRRYYCGVWKLQPKTWFKIKSAHCTHPENQVETHTIMNNIYSVTHGRDNVEKRKKKYDLYSKMKGMDETFEHYLEKDVKLKKYDEKEILNLVKEYNKYTPKFWIRWNGNIFINKDIIQNILSQILNKGENKNE